MLTSTVGDHVLINFRFRDNRSASSVSMISQTCRLSVRPSV